jgi:hypothetical protein
LLWLAFLTECERAVRPPTLALPTRGRGLDGGGGQNRK